MVFSKGKWSKKNLGGIKVIRKYVEILMFSWWKAAWGRVLRWVFKERKDKLAEKVSCSETLAEERMGGNHTEVVVGQVCLIRVDFSMTLKL